MGVKNLWKLFSPSKYKEPKNTTLGVDISTWLYQLNNTNILYNTFYRIIKLINNSNKPYFVFDGQPSFLKKLVLQKRKERRKENEFNNFVSNIVNNRMCKCKKLFRKCEHGSTKNEEYFSDLIKDVKFALKKHNYNWGKNYTSKDKIDLESKLFNLRNKKSKKEKLNCLLKLRELRSVYDYKSDECLEEFSAKQIENVKKRNKVLEMINQLERNKIMSDCKRIFYLREEKKESEEESELVFSDEDVLLEKNEEFLVMSEENEELQSKNEEKYEEFLSKSEDNEKSLLKIEDKEEFLLKSQENEKLVLKSEEKSVFSPKNNEEFFQLKNKESLKNIEFLENEVNDLQSESNFYNSEKEDDSQSEKESFKSEDELQSEKNDKKSIKEPKDKSIILNEINLLYVSALDTIKQVISSFNLPIIQSITESDAQLAYMNNTGTINYIISDDNDIFVYNGKSIYRNFFTSSPSLYFLPLKEDYQSFLIKLAHLLGCDYSVGMKNVGLSKALKIANSVKDEEVKYLKEIYCNSPVVEVKEYSFKVSKNKVVECFLKMGGSKEDSFKIKGLLEKCDCEYLEE